jgi:hypothetical protein
MKRLGVLPLLGSISLAVELPYLTRESLEKMFQSVRAEPGQLVIQIKNNGPRFSRRRGEEEATVNNYGETIRIKLGERLRFATHHMSLEFRPLPPPLDKHGFLIQSHFDARSFGGGQTTSYGIALVLKSAQGVDLRFVELPNNFDATLPPGDPTVTQLLKIVSEGEPLARHELVGRISSGEISPPFPQTVEELHLRWEKKAGVAAEPLEVRWIAVDIGRPDMEDHLIATDKSEPNKTEGEFSLTKPMAGFPPGQYRVEIWQTGKMIYSEKFEIERK